MTQEDKNLLLQDLCGRLPYGVICYNSNTENNFKLCDTADIDSGYPTFDYGYGELETVKPYLRSMSSMTKEELFEVQDIIGKGVEIRDVFINIVDSTIKSLSYAEIQAVFDWFNARHFDYRGLIEKGLAIEAPEGMYNNKK